MKRAASPVRLEKGGYFPEGAHLSVPKPQLLSEPFPLHWHEFFELTYIYAGKGTNRINGEDYPARQGMLQLLTPTDFHEMIPDCGHPLLLTNVHFSREMISDDLYGELFSNRSAGPLVACFNEEEQERLSSDMACLHRESQTAGKLSLIAAKAALTLLLTALARQASAGRAPPGAGAGATAATKPSGGSAPLPAWFRQATVFIEHHFREPIRLQDAAAVAGLSASYFSDAFHRLSGVPFSRYLLKLRLDYAHTLLRASDLPITEVCFASGFSTLTYFEKAFKARFGCTPRATGTKMP